jgi:serine/threonine protein kinase
MLQIEKLSKVNHKNFVNLLGYCEEEEPFTRMMVFEYAPNGTLFEHLHGERENICVRHLYGRPHTKNKDQLAAFHLLLRFVNLKNTVNRSKSMCRVNTKNHEEYLKTKDDCNFCLVNLPVKTIVLSV